MGNTDSFKNERMCPFSFLLVSPFTIDLYDLRVLFIEQNLYKSHL